MLISFIVHELHVPKISQINIGGIYPFYSPNWNLTFLGLLKPSIFIVYSNNFINKKRNNPALRGNKLMFPRFIGERFQKYRPYSYKRQLIEVNCSSNVIIWDNICLYQLLFSSRCPLNMANVKFSCLWRNLTI